MNIEFEAEVRARDVLIFLFGLILLGCLAAECSPAEAASDDAARAVRALERIAHALEKIEHLR